MRIVVRPEVFDHPDILALGPDALWLLLHAAARSSDLGMVPADLPCRLLDPPAAAAAAIRRLVDGGWWEPGPAGGWVARRLPGGRQVRS